MAYGIELNRKLQEINERIFLIFITGYDELEMQELGTNAIGLIRKEKIGINLENMLEKRIRMLNQFVMIDYQYDSREIIFIKSEHIYNCLYFVNRPKVLVRQSSESLERELNNAGFIRVSRSTLVNMNYIVKIVNDIIHLQNIKIHISIRLKSHVKKRYERFCDINRQRCNIT